VRYRTTRALVVAALAAGAALGLSSRHNDRLAAQSLPPCGTDMRILVVSAAGTEADFPAIKQALDYLGTPYDVYIAAQNPGGLTPSQLNVGCHAFYQGVILTTNTAVNATDLQTLASYEATFSVRQVTWYTWPTPDLGFNWATSSGSDPINARLTTAGSQVFTYLNASASASQIPIQYSWTYLTTPLDSTTVPLLTDDQGHSLAAIHTFPDGRQNLAMTFDSNPYLTHAMLLSYGVVNWVTGGLFIGERHAYMSPQVDDMFIDDDQWLMTTPCGTNVENTGHTFRITGADFTGVSTWQTLRQSAAMTAGLRLTMVFNGEGTTGNYSPDTLTSTAKTLQQQFYWVNHTYDHANLDAITSADAASEITLNNAVATTLGLTLFSPLNFVQPDVSGLGNVNFLNAAYSNGIRYVVSDTSKTGTGDNPSPNVGRWNALQAGIFQIPRRPTNLFYNVATPNDWLQEYNCMYNSYWGRNLTYNEVLDDQSTLLLSFLLRGELDPWMFHQPNLAAYQPNHSLLTDLLDATLTKYAGYYTLPIVTPTMDTLGQRMADRTALHNNRLSATIQPGVGIVLQSPVDVTVPITGLHLDGAESYGGQWISWVDLTANQPRVLPLPSSPADVAAPTVTAGAAQTVASDAAVTLTATASDPNNPPRTLTYSWAQTAGPAVALANADSLTATFSAPTLAVGDDPVTLTFALTVSNGLLTTKATTTVIVEPPVGAPSLSVGGPQIVLSGSSVTLTSTASDPNHPSRSLTYSWVQTSGPLVTLTAADAATARFTAPAIPIGEMPATLAFAVTVSNGALTTTSNTYVTVTPPIAPPTATSGGDQTVAAGASVTLAGAGSDPNLPLRPLTYRWVQTSGPAVALQNPNEAVASFVAPTLRPGAASLSLTFTLTVNNGSLTASAASTVTVQAPPLANAIGLVAAYDFNEGSGATVSDSSGYGNAGTISGATWAAGRSGSALYFDGTSNWVTVENSPSLSLNTGMTLEAWVNPEWLYRWPTIVHKEEPTSGGLSWALYASDNNAPPAVYSATPQDPWRHVTGPSLLPLNQWSHVAGTYDGAALRLYVNGVLVRSIAATGSMTPSTGPLRIGGNAPSIPFGGQFFKGRIDEVRIYDHALSQAEIQADMNAGPPMVTSVTPAAGTVNVATSTTARVTFSQPIAPGSITSASLSMTDSSLVPIAATVAYNASTLTATLTPAAPLANARTYSVSVKGGAGGVTDTDGTPLPADYVWSFTTESDTTGPTISNVKAAPTNRTAVITWTTNEPATSRLDYGTAADALPLNVSDGALVTSHSMFLSGLSPGKTYYFRVTSADAAANQRTTPATGSAPSTFVTSALVASYGFNEGGGSVLSDLSGLGNEGAIDGATWTTAGRFGGALSFDGVNDWVTINHSATLDLSTGMTIEAWVKPASSSGWRAILYKERPGTNAGLSYGLYSSDSSAPPAVYTAVPSNVWTHVTGTSMLPLNSWSHVAGTYDGATVRLYVNGVLVRSNSAPGPLLPSTGPLRIGGKSISAPGQFFQGLIDEIRIYNRPLSATEIRADMTTPVR
jgi:hypothetical protein